jgi:hypothetical protein
MWETNQAKDKEQRYHDGNLECTHSAATRKDAGSRLKGRLYSKRRKGRPRMRWQDDVESDLKKMKMKGWKGKTRAREQWRLVVEEAKTRPGL